MLDSPVNARYWQTPMAGGHDYSIVAVNWTQGGVCTIDVSYKGGSHWPWSRVLIILDQPVFVRMIGDEFFDVWQTLIIDRSDHAKFGPFYELLESPARAPYRDWFAITGVVPESRSKGIREYLIATDEECVHFLTFREPRFVDVRASETERADGVPDTAPKTAGT